MNVAKENGTTETLQVASKLEGKKVMLWKLLRSETYLGKT